MMSVLDHVDTSLVACICGHLRDEHCSGFFEPCNVDECGCEDYVLDEADAISQAQTYGNVYVSDRFTLSDVEAMIGSRAENWAGKCYAIATAVHRAAEEAGKGIGGRVVYGHFTGFVHPLGHFGARAALGFEQHGWIDLGDGNVLDPTRWVFENVDPYVYEGPGDDYDEGGNRLREMNQRACPSAGESETLQTLQLTTGAMALVGAISGGQLKAAPMSAIDGKVQLHLTAKQGHWIAGLALPVLGDYAGDVFSALVEAGMSVYIPIDNRLKVLAA
jgi:hypothetical protein